MVMMPSFVTDRLTSGFEHLNFFDSSFFGFGHLHFWVAVCSSVEVLDATPTRPRPVKAGSFIDPIVVEEASESPARDALSRLSLNDCFGCSAVEIRSVKDCRRSFSAHDLVPTLVVDLLAFSEPRLTTVRDFPDTARPVPTWFPVATRAAGSMDWGPRARPTVLPRARVDLAPVRPGMAEADRGRVAAAPRRPTPSIRPRLIRRSSPSMYLVWRVSTRYPTADATSPRLASTPRIPRD